MQFNKANPWVLGIAVLFWGLSLSFAEDVSPLLWRPEGQRFSSQDSSGRLRETGVRETTASGARFVQVTLDGVPEFENAWRDPSGMIWGDVVKNEDGAARRFILRDAKRYCRRIGAQLPTYEDFVRLGEYLGARGADAAGYTPQILPNLTYDSFWTSGDQMTR
jgi:hypothetical protein